MAAGDMYGERDFKTSTPAQSLPSELEELAKVLNIDLSNLPLLTGSDTAKKSGVYTQTQTSRQMPDDTALIDKINQVFKQFYKRDANQNEIATWLPALRGKYKSKEGTTKTTVKYTYKNGELINTDYLTADNLDPKLWLEDQIKNKLLAGGEEVNKIGIPEGPLGKNFVQIKNFAARNGIMLSDQAATDYATKIVAGVLDDNTVFNTIRESAASAFPQLADKIKAGIDVKTIADPYIQSMSNILEIPYTSVDLFDPKIRGALSYTLPDGKVGTKSIYDFERELRQDTRWQYTNNAKKAVADSTLRVLQDFGFQG
jgi:hypothetical protein